jgi:mannan endo-1,4-beta-mannosidase
VYLGAWIDPYLSAGGLDLQREMQNVPVLQQAIGRRLDIVHVYTIWAGSAPIRALEAVSANGTIPLLDWACGIPDASVAAGDADTAIAAYAEALKSYGKPVFLRWYWEMNLQQSRTSCQSAGGAADYVAAWRRIWQIFQQVGASNVSFVWSPGLAGVNPASYYPGDTYVDWIGIDGYDVHNQGTQAFTALFSSFYQTWSPHSKPMMVAETGAVSSDQAAFLAGAQAALPNYPAFKAFVYWDAVGKTASWYLSGSGLSAFRTMAQSPHFVTG